MRAYEDEITLLAPRTAGEPSSISVSIWADLHDVQNRGEQFFVLHGDVGFKDTAFGLLLYVRDSAQDSIA